MKDSKRTILTAVLLIALSLCVVFLILNYTGSTANEPVERERTEHEALAAIGHYGRNISYTENIGDLSFNIKAERISARKSTILGFSTSLKKNMVAENLELTVYDRGKRLYICKKDEVVMPYDMDVIEIENPYTVFPRSMSRVRLIRIDRKGRKIMITDQNGERQLHSSQGIPELNIP